MTIEELQQQVLDLTEKVQTLTDENKTTKDSLDKQLEENKKLVEHNQKLFLRVTEKMDEESEDEGGDEENEMKEYIGEKIYSSLSNKDKEMLDNIMNGEDE